MVDREKLEVGEIYLHLGAAPRSAGTEFYIFRGESEEGNPLFEALSGEDEGKIVSLTGPQVDGLVGPLETDSSS